MAEARAILELPDGTRFDIDGRAAQMAMSLVLHQRAINAVDTGMVKFTFQGKRLHPLRLSSSLQTTNLPTTLE